MTAKHMVLFLACVVALISSIYSGWKEYSAKDWPTVWGRVLDSSFFDKDRENKVRYTYRVDGVQYDGKQQFDAFVSREPAREPEGPRPEGRGAVAVYYNPSKPRQSMLKPGITSKTIGMGAFGICGLLLFPCAWISARRKRAEAV